MPVEERSDWLPHFHQSVPCRAAMATHVASHHHQIDDQIVFDEDRPVPATLNSPLTSDWLLLCLLAGAAQLLERLSSSRLVASLKEVLVERDRLTLGKELGKGECVCERVVRGDGGRGRGWGGWNNKIKN